MSGGGISCLALPTLIATCRRCEAAMQISLKPGTRKDYIEGFERIMQRVFGTHKGIKLACTFKTRIPEVPGILVCYTGQR